MTKTDFLRTLRGNLSGVPKDEINSTVDFYSEMIDERVEEGLSEEEAVFAAGEPAQIAERIRRESGNTSAKKKRRLKPWEIVLLSVGSPLWISLGAAAIVVALALYAVLWSLVISTYAVTVAFAAGTVAGIASAVIMLASGKLAASAVYIGAVLLCAGLAVFAALLSKAATKGIWKLTLMPLRILRRSAGVGSDNGKESVE